jgi:excisionase family DNA binding protein
MNDILEKKFYTPKEIANLLKLSERTIQRQLKSGQIKGTLIGRNWRISESQLEKLLDEGSHQ